MKLLSTVGGGSPTGQPLQVADAAERLAQTPVNKMRVEQLDTGKFWVYDDGFGGWVPNPPLIVDTPLGEVSPGIYVQTFSHPDSAEGTSTKNATVTSTLIQPVQTYAENIDKFAMGENPITLADSTNVNINLFSGWITHCNAVLTQAPEFYASGSPLENVGALLAQAKTVYSIMSYSGGDFHFANSSAERINPFNVDKVYLEDQGATVSVYRTVPALVGTHTGWTDQSNMTTPPYFSDGLGDAGHYFNPSTTTQVNSSFPTASSPSVLNLAGLDLLVTVSLDGLATITEITNPPNSLATVTIAAQASGLLTSLNLSNLPNLYTVAVYNCDSITSVRLANCPAITGGVNVSGCSLDAAALDQLILDLHANAVGGALNGLLDISAQTTSAAPSLAVATELAELSAIYGWTVTT